MTIPNPHVRPSTEDGRHRIRSRDEVGSPSPDDRRDQRPDAREGPRARGDRLWAAQDACGLAPTGGEFEPESRLEGELGYGLALFGDRFTGTPNVGFGLTGAGARDYRIGWRLTPWCGAIRASRSASMRPAASPRTTTARTRRSSTG